MVIAIHAHTHTSWYQLKTLFPQNVMPWRFRLFWVLFICSYLLLLYRKKKLRNACSILCHQFSTNNNFEICYVYMQVSCWTFSRHCDLILLGHGRKPRRAKSRKSEMREGVLKEAWRRLGDLSSVSQENKVQRVRTFLKSVDTFTILSPGERAIHSNSNSN